jgi:protein TonB
MKVGISPERGAEQGSRSWVHEWLRQPIAQGFLISLALHLAIVLLVQSAPATQGRHTVVINARLQAVASPRVPASLEQTPAPVVASNAIPILPAVPPAKDSAVVPAATPLPITQPPVNPQPVTPTHAATVSSATPAEASSAATRLPGPPQSSGLPSLPMGIDTNWYLARQVDSHPKAIGQIQPEYPEEAKRRNLEGTLKLMLKIDDLGRVQSVEVVEATPPGVFDEAALAAFRGAHFQPAMKDGRPVRYQAYMRVDFKLRD